MLNEPRRQIVIRYTEGFVAEVKELRRRFPHIQSDLRPVLERVEQGDIIGDRVQGIGHPIFNVRVLNRFLKKGKNAGYRYVYWLQTPNLAVSSAIHATSDRIDISANESGAIIEKHMRNPH